MTGHPQHQAVLTDLRAQRALYDQAISALEALLGLAPPVTAEPAVPTMPPAMTAVEPVPRPALEHEAPPQRTTTRRARGARTDTSRTPPKAEDAPDDGAERGRVSPGHYDKRCVIAVRDAGPLGLTLSDVTRACVGPGRPEEVARKIGTIKDVLTRLIGAGALVRDGRYYKLAPRDED